ncbi:MAG: MbcA/ParS/Xre antitoxin family protein [Vulcanimicrobiaceae bacterium]|jgi:hypothetical protein
MANSRTSAPAAERTADVAARHGAAALRTFFQIAEAWHLTGNEQKVLLGLPRSTLAKYRADPASARLSVDTAERLSYLFGIYRGLQILLPRPEAADDWVRRPNDAPPFHGQSALERMLSGRVADLYTVRHYLDGQRGW